MWRWLARLPGCVLISFGIPSVPVWYASGLASIWYSLGRRTRFFLRPSHAETERALTAARAQLRLLGIRPASPPEVDSNPMVAGSYLSCHEDESKVTRNQA